MTGFPGKIHVSTFIKRDKRDCMANQIKHMERMPSAFAGVGGDSSRASHLTDDNL